jgi:hypothetical protein
VCTTRLQTGFGVDAERGFFFQNNNENKQMMVFDLATSLFVPVAYAALTSKRRELYANVFLELAQLCNNKWPREDTHIIVDFEKSLHQAVRETLSTCRVCEWRGEGEE